MKKRQVAALGLTVALLAGCSKAPQSSVPPFSASSLAASSLAPAPSASASSLPQRPTWDDLSDDVMDRVYENYAHTQNLPPAPYTPMAEAELAAELSLFHFLDPALLAGAEGLVPQPVLMLRFYPTGNEMAFSRGVYETDASQGFIGSYTYVGDGVIEASLGERLIVAGDDGPLMEQSEETFTLRITLSWSAEENLAVVAIDSAGAVGNAPFARWIAPHLQDQLAFAKTF